MRDRHGSRRRAAQSHSGTARRQISGWEGTHETEHHQLDRDQSVCAEKIKALIDDAGINTLTVMIMQVPCCRGLLQLARQAVAQAERKVPIKCVVVGVQGELLQDEWVS